MARVRRLRMHEMMDDTSVSSTLAQRFECFLRRERDALVRFLRRRLASRDDAEDAAQESFIRLMRYRDQRPESAWKPLLYRIASNVAHDEWRHARVRRQDAHEPFDEAVHGTPGAVPPQEQRLAQQQDLARAKAVILALPPRCRHVYLLSRMHGMSYAEIADHLAISVKAVEKHVSRALRTLRVELGSRERSTLQEQAGADS